MMPTSPEPLPEELADVDRALRALMPTAVSDETLARIHARVQLGDATGFERLPRAKRWGMLAVGALLCMAIGSAGGWRLAGRSTPRGETVMVSRPASGGFVLLLERDFDAWKAASDTTRAEWTRDFGRWVSSPELQSAGGVSLSGEGARLVLLDDRQPSVQLLRMSGLAPLGFIVVRSATYDEATRIAKTCPLIEQGGRVFIRRLN